MNAVSGHEFVFVGAKRSKGTPVQEVSFRKRLDAAARTSRKLVAHGARELPLREERETAAALAYLYAKDPWTARRMMGVQTMSVLTPAAILAAQKIVRDFSATVVANAEQIRALVTNKLIIETDSPDPKVRLKALELLGKFEDVGLFTEKTEVSISTYTLNELHERLREKLGRLSSPGVEDAVVLDDKAIDVDAELGLEPEVHMMPEPLPEVPEDIEEALAQKYARVAPSDDES